MVVGATGMPHLQDVEVRKTISVSGTTHLWKCGQLQLLLADGVR